MVTVAKALIQPHALSLSEVRGLALITQGPPDSAVVRALPQAKDSGCL